MTQEKEYYAFISYKREDEKWAKWLQHKLEHYKFPTNLNGRTDLPKHIRPTFRDVTDLKPGLLAEEINNALCNSQWLVIVCSPRSAKSPWVCKEAQTFIDLGRADHIIPFVIEGTPFSGDTTTECYPEALLHLTGSKELLAANINEMGRDAAAIKVVARMFNLRFDTLWQRHERELRARRWMQMGTALFVALVGLAVGGYFVKQNNIIKNQQELLQKDSATMADHIIRIQRDSLRLSAQNDSILSQNNLILKQRDSLDLSAKNLLLSNKLLAEERDNVLLANNLMMKAQNRAVAKEANSLIERGELLIAARLLINTLPCENENVYSQYVPETEYAIRRVLDSLLVSDWHKEAVFTHNLKINSVGFSSNGDKIVTGSNDNIAKIWDTSSGIEDFRLCHDCLVTCAIYSPNDKYIATGSRDEKVRIWNAKNGDLLEILETTGNIWSLAFSPNNDLLFAQTSGALHVWSIPNWESLLMLPGGGTVSKESFSHDGRSFLLESSMNAMLCPIEYIKGKHGRILKDAISQANEMAYVNEFLSWGENINAHYYIQEAKVAPTGDKILVIREDGLSFVLDVNNYKVIGDTLRNVINACFNNNGDLIAIAHSDNSVCVYDASNCKFKHKYKTEGKPNYCIFSPDDNFILVCSDDMNIHIWEIQGNKKLITKLSHDRPVKYAEYSKDGNQIISATDDNRVHLWRKNIIDDIPIKFAVGNGYPTSSCISSDGENVLLASSDNCLYQFNMNNYKLNIPPMQHPDIISHVEYHPNHKYIISACYDGIARIWNSKTGKLVAQTDKSQKRLNSAVYNNEGNMIITSSSDSIVRIYNMKNFPKEKKLVHNGPVRYARFSNNSKMIITVCGNKIHLWNTNSGLLMSSTLPYTDGIIKAVFSKDDKKIIAVTENNSICIWDTQKLESCEKEIRHGVDMRPNFNLESENYYEFYRSKSETSSLNARNDGGELARLLSHKEAVNSIDISDDGRYMLTTSTNNAKIWEISTGKIVCDDMVHFWNVDNAMFCKNGEYILTSGKSGFLSVWKYISVQRVVRKLIERIQTTKLNEEEKEKFFFK